ncbi:MAG: PatB family C-S lyase [Chloroflexota bacterium]
MTTTTSPYDFDTYVERRNTGSAKWDYFGDVLPLWVADSDFRCPEPVLRAMHERVDHGIFGYQMDSPRLREILVERMASHYGWIIEAKNITFLPNLVSALNVSARAFAEPGESVLMNSPIYPPFISAPKNGGREAIFAELAQIQQGQIIRYEIDFDRLEAAVTPSTKVFLLCNPHNPVGRVYEKWELEKLADFCMRHNLIICSDDIHCDLIFDGYRHQPIAALAPEVAARTITIMAPSKTFNMPTLGFGFAIAQSEDILKRFQTASDGIMAHPGAIGYVAAEAAYGQCQDYVDALMVYLEGNRNYLLRYFEENFPQVPITRPEGTYLAWSDWNALNLPEAPFKFFLEKAKVAFSDGASFGKPGEGFLRINFACPRATLTEALERVSAAIASL